ncbi:unnamed protein product [Lepeophtheirus salmonis]|uniref:(salmon louse) hypothetical protein n=1 Tax=Lepeophtheirus salmonis TaxID=72036 RepID=A0A7R8H3S7_LEPSM|nr:unnamed protein product [Lepeophtheirus salmonis]CAF2849758.1 unnamed protein product [Lepeophtheirus salmonis]
MCLKIYHHVILLQILSFCLADNLCAPPEIKHGEITVVSSNNRKFVGIVGCEPPYALVGQNLIKCMNGIWSAEIPVCTNLSGCDIATLPEIENGWRRPMKLYRGSVVRYTCAKGYKLYGRKRVHCDSYGHWNLDRPPICVRKGCDETLINTFSNGKSKRLLSGEVYVFQCNEGNSLLQGSRTIYCNGKKWNDTVPNCIASPGQPFLYFYNSNNVEVPNIKVNDVGISVVCMSSSSTFDSPSLALYEEGRLIKEVHESSKLILSLPKISKDDDQTTFVCSASNAYTNTFGNDELNVARIKLNVTGASQFVSIQMNSQPGIKRMYLKENGTSVIRIECLSDESKPPTYLQWKTQFNSAIVDVNDMIHPSSRPHWSRAQSILSLNVSSIESNIKVECSDGNGNMDGIVLVKTNAPKKVQITGNNILKYNGQNLMSCHVGQSTPAAKIYWDVPHGIEYNVSMDKMVSNISYLHLGPVQQEESDNASPSSFTIKCIVKHPALKNKKISSHFLVNISYPPSSPLISTENEMPLTVGQEAFFVCSVSSKGHIPSSELVWILDGQIMNNSPMIQNEHQEIYISLFPKLSDHGKFLRCEWNDNELWSEIFDDMELLIVEPLQSIIKENPMTSSIKPIEFDITDSTLLYSLISAYKEEVSSTEKYFPISATNQNEYTTLAILYDSNKELNVSSSIDSFGKYDDDFTGGENEKAQSFELPERNATLENTFPYQI